MRKTITINIPEPCTEDWNKMTPKERGRHCDVCNKVVIDFTSSTDEAIFKAHQNNTKICGRYKKTQLNREIVYSRKEKNNFAAYLATGLFTLFSITSQNTFAQVKPKIIKVDTIKTPRVNNKLTTSILPTKLIEGLVYDESKLPLPGVNIIIKGKTIGTQTDFDGKFNLRVNKGDVLVFSYVGLKTKEITITNFNKIDIILEEDSTILGGEVVIVGGAVAGDPIYSYSYTLELRKQARQEHRGKIRNGEIERTSIGWFLHKLTNFLRKKEVRKK